MTHTFSRQELYELVWSEPKSTLAKRLGISDVGLAKACRRADIPVPGSGTGRSSSTVRRCDASRSHQPARVFST